MNAMPGHFDFALAYLQWQGSGRHENLPRGAEATARVCERFAPRVDVPLSEKVESAEGVNRWSAIFEQFRSAQELLARHAPNRVLTAGGDCAVDIAVIDYLNALYPNLTVIWIDSHLDANTPATSPSGSFHGMPVSAIMGSAPEPMKILLNGAVAPERFFYVHAHIGDDGDWAFQRDQQLRTFEPQSGVRGPVHIHFDLDVLDPSEFPYLAYPETDGLSVDKAVALVSGIARNADVVGLTITEFAPSNEADALEGSKVIDRLCIAAVGQ